MASQPKIVWVPKERADRCTCCGDKGADVVFQVAALNFALCPRCVLVLANGTRLMVEMHDLQETEG